MIVELQLDVIAPDEELAKAGLCYATLHRPVELPFTPFIGLRLFLPSNLQDNNDVRKDRYSQLFKEISNPTAIFDTRNVDYHLPSKWSAGRIKVIANEAFEPTLERFQAYISFLTEFYDFEQII